MEFNYSAVIDNFFDDFEESERARFEVYFKHSFPDLIYRLFEERINVYIAVDSAFLHLLDEVFLFTQKFQTLVPFKKPPSFFCATALISPAINLVAFEKWKKLVLSTMLSNLTKSLNASESLKQRFSDLPEYNHEHYPEISYVVLSTINSIFKKAMITENLDLKRGLVEVTFCVYSKIAEKIHSAFPSELKIQSLLTTCLALSNALSHIRAHFVNILTEKWFILLCTDPDFFSLRDDHERLVLKLDSLLNKKLSDIAGSFINFLKSISSNTMSSANCFEGIDSLFTVFQEIKKFIEQHVTSHLSPSSAHTLVVKINEKIDPFFKEMLFLCAPIPLFLKQDVQHAFAACVVEPCSKFIPNSAVCPLSSLELAKNFA